MTDYRTHVLSVFTAVKYKSEKDFGSDFSCAPRPCHNIAFMLSGKGEVEADGKRFEVNAGKILFIPKGTTYKVKWSGDGQKISFHAIHFDFYADADPFSDKTAKVCAVIPDDFAALYEKMKTLAEYQYRTDYKYFSALAAFYDVLSETLSKASVEENEILCPSVLPAIRRIQNDHTEKLTVGQLAAECFLSPSRFYPLFKKQTGRSPIAYKNELTVRRATQILLTDREKSIETISEELGFDSAIYFRRLFKKSTGLTPTEFRERSATI
ncbi:MAG: AraC family transcriptional regulator [Clostridia bacterium]|nr:AraC family transcriptional regulator [Clostridia bacterium]